MQLLGLIPFNGSEPMQERMFKGGPGIQQGYGAGPSQSPQGEAVHQMPPFHGPRQALVGKGISIANPRPAQALYTRKDSGTYPTRSMDGSRKVPHLPPWAYGLGISPPQG